MSLLQEDEAPGEQKARLDVGKDALPAPLNQCLVSLRIKTLHVGNLTILMLFVSLYFLFFLIILNIWSSSVKCQPVKILIKFRLWFNKGSG